METDTKTYSYFRQTLSNCTDITHAKKRSHVTIGSEWHRMALLGWYEMPLEPRRFRRLGLTSSAQLQRQGIAGGQKGQLTAGEKCAITLPRAIIQAKDGRA